MKSRCRPYLALVAVLSIAVAPSIVLAQAPGLPVLQDAFFSRGFGIGVDAAGGDGTSTRAVAASYSPLSGTLQLVAGAGTMRFSKASSTSYGVRAAFRFRTFGAQRQIGAAIFVGAGGAGAKETRVARAPFGLSLAYRRALGTTRALAVYAAPYYDATRVTRADGSADKGSRFRSGIGADVAITPSIGAGLGVDIGGKGAVGSSLAGSTQFGGGVSYHF